MGRQNGGRKNIGPASRASRERFGEEELGHAQFAPLADFFSHTPFFASYPNRSFRASHTPTVARSPASSIAQETWDSFVNPDEIETSHSNL